MNLPKISRENNCIYLTQDLSNMGIYDRSKAIVNFCDKETKKFESEIDGLIIDIFNENGINIPSTDKSVLKLAFELLNAKGISIDIVDLYKNHNQIIKKTKNHFTIVIDYEYIECGVEIVVKKLGETSNEAIH